MIFVVLSICQLCVRRRSVTSQNACSCVRDWTASRSSGTWQTSTRKHWYQMTTIPSARYGSCLWLWYLCLSQKIYIVAVLSFKRSRFDCRCSCSTCVFTNHVTSAVEQRHYQPSETATDHPPAWVCWPLLTMWSSVWHLLCWHLTLILLKDFKPTY